RFVKIASVIALFVGLAFSAPAEPPTPPVSAPSAIVLDRDSGAVLGAKDPDTRRSMASTTKIMTALLAIEQQGGNIDQIVGPVSAKAAGMTGSRMNLQTGDRLSL